MTNKVDETEINARIITLQTQRNAACDQVVLMGGTIAVLQAALKEQAEKIKTLEGELTDAREVLAEQDKSIDKLLGHEEPSEPETLPPAV